MGQVADIRSETPLSPADVDAIVEAALADLERLEIEAAGFGDPMHSHFTAMKQVLTALKTIADFTAERAAAIREPISDENWRTIRGDIRRTLTAVIAGQADTMFQALRLRAIPLLPGLLVAALLSGVGAGRFAWPGDPRAIVCADQNDGSRWCEVRAPA